MLLKHDNKQAVRCKISKFIKMPFIYIKDAKSQQRYTNSKHPLPLYTVLRSNHQTIFYAKNDIVYFHSSTLINESNIITFYDCNKETYHLIKLDHVKTGYISNLISCFTAPSGRTYFVYLAKESGSSKDDLVIYDYTKNKIAYRKEPQWLDTITFAIPIANSFLVSVSRSGYSIWIRVIDVTTEGEYNESDIDLFIVSLEEYFLNVIYLLENKASKGDIRNLSKVANDIAAGLLRSEDIQYIGVPKITIMASVHDKDIVFYKGFKMQFDQVRIRGLSTTIHKAFSISFMFEEDRIIIQAGTGEGDYDAKGYIIIKSNFIHVPPDIYWFVDEYKLKNKYNLSNSKLHSVSKVSKDYLIINGTMYYSEPNVPKTYRGYDIERDVTYMFDYEDISILNVGYNRIMAALGLTASKISYKTAVYVNKKSYDKVYIIETNQLANNIRQIKNYHNDSPSEILELPNDLIKEISFDDEISEFLSKMYGTTHSISFYDYWYYVDEEKGYIYCLVIYKNTDESRDVYLLRYYMKNNDILPKVIGYLKIKSDELKDDKNLLNVKVLSLIAHDRYDKLHIARMLLSYRHNRIYNYMNEVVFELKNQLFRLRDVKHNRNGVLEYYNTRFKEINNVYTRRRYNVVTWSISGKVGRRRDNVQLIFVISEITTTKRMKLMNNRGYFS
jgi:hypothetical protein